MCFKILEKLFDFWYKSDILKPSSKYSIIFTDLGTICILDGIL